MEKMHLVALLGTGAALLLGGIGCPTRKEPPPAPPPPATAPETTQETSPPATEAEDKAENSLTVRDQDVKNSAVVIDKVKISENGWVAVHEVINGRINYVIGFTAVKKGETTNVVVSVRKDRVTPLLMAMLHTDKGQIGKFEYSAVDLPVIMDNKKRVMKAFKVTNFASLKSAAPAPAPAPSASSPSTVPSEPSPFAPSPSASGLTPPQPNVVPMTPETREFTITAKQWEFSPASITVNKDEKVILHVKSVDVTHGFSLPAYGVSFTLEPGKISTAEFKAIQQGTFPFSCSFYCGEGHGRMTGTLIVK